MLEGSAYITSFDKYDTCQKLDISPRSDASAARIGHSPLRALSCPSGRSSRQMEKSVALEAETELECTHPSSLASQAGYPEACLPLPASLPVS